MNKYEKIAGVLLSFVSLFSGSCTLEEVSQNNGSESGENSLNSGSLSSSDVIDTENSSVIEYAFNGVYTKGELLDDKRSFSSVDDVSSARLYYNGEFVETFSNFSSRTDAKAEFYNGRYVKMVDYSGGMTYCLPTESILDVDYSIAQYRLRIALGDSLLTVSAEHSNPYSATTDPWSIYRDEWLLRFLNDDTYIVENELERIGDVLYNDLTIKLGYDIYYYAVHIKNSEEIERPYYNIAVIRKEKDTTNFGLFVMKSKVDRTADMMEIIDSYSFITRKGTAYNYFDAGQAVGNESWSEETDSYFRQLISEDKVNWGLFSYSMYSENSFSYKGEYEEQYKKIKSIQTEAERELEYAYDIYPTYTHLQYEFPETMAEDFASGNGKNEKPVLQFTYQFTTDNNSFADNKTPMFDILRGNYDATFRKLAKAMKAYGKPILFRLNNEMNTDWTSYCGMVTLLDPDIFTMTWKRLYDIFEQEAVDNCIWIWNPIGTSCPYSSWGEDLCYFPGIKYVHLLGLTSYEMGNGDEFSSFETRYRMLYEKNISFYGYAAIISEFACGSGGETSGTLGRNASKQASWVEEMFNEINADEKDDYVKQIKGAVWFNCNDYSDGLVNNRLKIINADDYWNEDYSDLQDTIKAFRVGLNYIE